MTRKLLLMMCVVALTACSGPKVTAQKKAKLEGNDVQFTSGTLNTGRFISVANLNKSWLGPLKGGKEKFGMRRNFLNAAARYEIERICGSWFIAIRKGPIYNMLDSDETMGGVAPALGVTVAMVAYLAAEASTQVTNIPTSAYIEFSCPDDK